MLKNNVDFKFGESELKIFEELKQIISSRPVLALYSPIAETQLHCDASSIGFGSILMQKQKDGNFHPIFYFSKRTTEPESRYHSYELECLCIVYSIKRFHVYLHGIKFTIFTDCDSLRLTLNKKDIVPRIMRWALFLESYDYKIEHRPNTRMRHVDALSRCHNILVLEENSFEQVLSVKQLLDPEIAQIKEKLQNTQLPYYELRDGLVYRKTDKNNLLFYVPGSMVSNVIRTCHDNFGHVGTEKTCEIIKRTYWFPQMHKTVKEYINNCLKCTTFSPKYGKSEGELHNIPKGKVPFETIHIDHYGPLEKCRNGDKYIFLVIDAFTKFIKLYPCKTTNTKEVLKHLSSYFIHYSKPNQIISDRGTCFTSNAFREFLESKNIKHVLIATGCPWANGQVERFNLVLGPMLAKLCKSPEMWNEILSDGEFAINNTVCKTTGEAPSCLLFGVYQKGIVDDNIRLELESRQTYDQENLLKDLRQRASDNIKKSQQYNKARYDKIHKKPHRYKVGDKIVIVNYDTTPGTNKKLIPKFKGPYEVNVVLDNDRYVIKDIEGYQVTRLPFTGTVDASHMKPWLPDTNYRSYVSDDE